MKALFLGLTTVDIQYLVSEHPSANTKVKTKPPQILIGGPAANAAITCSHLGLESYFITNFGDNPFQSFFQTDMALYNVNIVDLVAGKKNPPVLATVLTNSENGDRTIVTNNPEDQEPNSHLLLHLLRNDTFDVILWDGFYPSIAKCIFPFAKENNIPILFDGGSWKPWLPPLLPYIDVAICSEVFLPPNCEDHTDVFHFLQKNGIKERLITRGEKSILWQKNNHEITEIDVITTNNVVDTLGAGDIFHGAFAYYFAKYKQIETASTKASVIASRSIQFEGTRSWLKSV